MKTISPALRTLLTGGDTFITADCYTFTLRDESVLRITNHDLPVYVGGVNFILFTPLSDSGVTQEVGFQVDDVTLNIASDERHTINGVQWQTWVEAGGLDGAWVRIDRAYAAGLGAAWVGTLNRFVGQVTDVQSSGATIMQVTVSSPIQVMNVNVPVDLYQSSCLNALYSPRCGVNPASFVVAGHATASANPGDPLATNLTNPDGYFNLGSIAFTSGENAGLRRAVKSSTSAGALAISPPFPEPIGIGDTFNIYPGCALSMAACTGFSNLLRFRGQPFIPPPVTLLGGVA